MFSDHEDVMTFRPCLLQFIAPVHSEADVVGEVLHQTGGHHSSSKIDLDCKHVLGRKDKCAVVICCIRLFGFTHNGIADIESIHGIGP